MNKLSFLLLLVATLSACSDKAEHPRKQQIVKLQLPDTPPPPPPPPKEQEKLQPKPDDKPPPPDAPKPVEAPQPQALKSDEAAGDGPGNGLTAGAVSTEYKDQQIGQGNTIGGVAPDNTVNKFAVNSFANATTRALNEFLVRDKDVKRLDYKVRVEVWLTPVGSLQRAELVGSTGDEQTDQALRTALARFPGTGSPPPASMPQPLRVMVSNRLMG
jgi:periplasmic protein TonB